MKYLFFALIGLVVANNATAAAVCVGTIDAVYKWHNMTSLSIRILMDDGTVTSWINMPTKSDEAMALTALTAQKSVVVYWSASDVTTCANGWQHNRALEGCMVVNK